MWHFSSNWLLSLPLCVEMRYLSNPQVGLLVFLTNFMLDMWLLQLNIHHSWHWNLFSSTFMNRSRGRIDVHWLIFPESSLQHHVLIATIFLGLMSVPVWQSNWTVCHLLHLAQLAVPSEMIYSSLRRGLLTSRSLSLIEAVWSFMILVGKSLHHILAFLKNCSKYFDHCQHVCSAQQTHRPILQLPNLKQILTLRARSQSANHLLSLVGLRKSSQHNLCGW